MADPPTDDRLAQAVTMLTTEHFTLQSARSAAIAEASQRAGLFIGTVSGTMIALGFIGQGAGVGSTEFAVFTLVLLPTLYFLGVVTYARVLQSAEEDGLFARGISRIRHYYVEVAPQTAPYFVLSIHDDALSTLGVRDIGRSRRQLFLTTAESVAVINSVIAGVLVGLVVETIAAPPLPVPAAAGLVAFVVSETILILHQIARWRHLERLLARRFPNAPGEDRSVSEDSADG